MQLDNNTKRMRWFILIVTSIGLLASLAASITLMFMTRNPLALALPSSVLAIVLPIILHFFPPGREKGAKNDQQS